MRLTIGATQYLIRYYATHNVFCTHMSQHTVNKLQQVLGAGWLLMAKHAPRDHARRCKSVQVRASPCKSVHTTKNTHTHDVGVLFANKQRPNARVKLPKRPVCKTLHMLQSLMGFDTQCAAQ